MTSSPTVIRPPTLQSNFSSPLNSPSSFPALSSPLTQPAASPAPSTLSGYSSPQQPSTAQAQNLFLASHSLPSFDSLPSPTGSVGSAGQRGRGRPKGSKNKRGKDDALATPSGVENANSCAMPPPTPPSQPPSWGVPQQQQTAPVFQQSQTFGQLPVAGYHQQHYSPAAVASPVQPQQPQQPQQVNGGYANPAASAGNVSFTQLNQRIPYQNSQSFNNPSNQNLGYNQIWNQEP